MPLLWGEKSTEPGPALEGVGSAEEKELMLLDQNLLGRARAQFCELQAGCSWSMAHSFVPKEMPPVLGATEQGTVHSTESWEQCPWLLTSLPSCVETNYGLRAEESSSA